MTALVVLDAFGLEPRWLQTTELELPVAGLPRVIDGYKIAQVSDAHLRTIGAVEEAILREIHTRDVSLVVLTGDVIDAVQYLPVLVEFCQLLQGNRRTVIATLGNWEHWGRLPLRFLREKYLAQKVNLLVNQSVLIDSVVSVVGTDDSTGGTVRIQDAVRDRVKTAVNLFLTHSPGLLDRLPETIGRFNLALAGHTHGGQGRLGASAPFRPPGSGRFISGWYEVPIARAYVSRGTGTSVIPARLACRPELPIFTLRQG